MSDYTTTPNLGLIKPTPNADGDLWGGHLNQNADTLDAVLSTTTGGKFLPLSGGTLTGPLTLAANATLALQAVTLQQLNSAVGVGPFLPLTGGTVTGTLTLTGTPTGLAVTANATVGGTLTVTSSLSAASQLMSGQPWASAPTGASLGPMTLIGISAGLGVATNANGTLAIGYQAGGGAGPGMSGGENTFVGSMTGRSMTTGNFNTGIGLNVMGLCTVENGNTCVGNDAMRDATGSYNTVVGNPCLRDGIFNHMVVVGQGALTANNMPTATATDSVVVGYLAAGQITTPHNFSNNVIIGASAGNAVTTGSNDVLIGRQAGMGMTTGGLNVLIGANAGINQTTGNNSVLIGTNAGLAVTTAASNIGIGLGALGGSPATPIGGSNIAIGNGTGNKLAGGVAANNVLIGPAVASATLAGGGSNIYIGASGAIDATAAGESNNFRLGNNAINLMRATGINTGAPAFFLDWLPASTTYANDAAAATGGVGVGQLYRNGSALQVRVA